MIGKQSLSWTRTIALSLLNQPLQVFQPFVFRKLFYRIAQHRAGHPLIMRFEEFFLHGRIPLTDFTQHPAYRFVHQVFLIRKQQPGNCQRVGKLIIFNEVKRGNDRNAPLPEAFRARQSIERASVFIRQIGAHNQIRGQIDQIPVIDVSGVLQIQFIDGFLIRGICLEKTFAPAIRARTGVLHGRPT